MAEYVGGEPMSVGVGDPITFENKTNDSFSVDVGIVFRKSGLYRVIVDGKHTSVEIEPERKRGKWICTDDLNEYGQCSCCGLAEDVYEYVRHWNYCPNCGAEMRGGE